MNSSRPSLWAGALALAASAWSAAPLTAESTPAVLRVIVAADEAPETFSLKPGEQPGFERELLEGFARLRGSRIEAVRAKTYPDRIPMLLKSDGDLIVAIFDTPERRKQVDFTTEVMPTHNVAVTLQPRPRIDRLDELRTVKVAVIRGASPAEDAAKAGIPPRSLIAFDRVEDLVRALQAKEVDTAVLPISEMALASRRVSGLEAGVTVGSPGTIAWAVRKEDTALREALDEYLRNVRRGPTWSRLVVKYFGDQTLAVLGRSR
jgi:ABC-type amino acid transport substrate-binding protein